MKVFSFTALLLAVLFGFSGCDDQSSGGPILLDNPLIGNWLMTDYNSVAVSSADDTTQAGSVSTTTTTYGGGSYLLSFNSSGGFQTAGSYSLNLYTVVDGFGDLALEQSFEVTDVTASGSWSVNGGQVIFRGGQISGNSGTSGFDLGVSGAVPFTIVGDELIFENTTTTEGLHNGFEITTVTTVTQTYTRQ